MFFADALYALAALLITSELLWSHSLVPSIALLTTLAAVVILQRPALRMSSVLPIVFGQGLLFCVGIYIGIRSEVGWGQITVLAVVHALAVVIAGQHIRRQLNVAIAAIPSMGLVHVLTVHPGSGDLEWAAAITVWALASWPLLAMFVHGRSWAWVACLGCAAFAVMCNELLSRAGASPGTGRLVLTGWWQHVSPILAITQAVLVGLAALPLIIEANFRWRVCVGLGTTVGVSTVAIWQYTSPNPEVTIPLIVTLCISGVLIVTGLIAVLITVRRPYLLSDLAIRSLTLGLAAGSIIIFEGFHKQIPADELVPLLSAGLAPVLIGMHLALIAAVAAFTAPKVGGQRIPTIKLKRDWQLFRSHFSSSLVEFSRDMVGLGQRKKWHQHLHAQLVPLVIFLSAWPALLAMNYMQAVVWLCVPSFLISSLARSRVLTWLLLYVAIIATASFIMGIEITLLPVCLAVALLAAWPFQRWSRLDVGWVYPMAILALAPVWMVLQPGDPATPLMACGLVILLANAIRRGPARWVLLIIGAFFIGFVLRNWVPSVDPYSSYVLQDTTPAIEFSHALSRTPLIILFFGVLWLTRVHALKLIRAESSLRYYLLVGACIFGGVLWALGIRPNIYQAFGYWLIVLVVFVPCAKYLGRRKGSWRHPITAAMALTLSVLVVATAEVQALAHIKHQGEVPAGQLGVHFLAGLRDVIAIMLAMTMVLALRVAAHQGERLLPTKVYHFVAHKLPKLKKRKPETVAESGS